MALYRRADSPVWWHDFTLKGRRFRGSSETTDRALAEAHETKLKHDIQFASLAGHKPRYTLNEAFGLYFDQHAHRLPSADDIERASRTLLAGLGKAARLHELTDHMVAHYVARRRSAVSDSSVNRELTLLRAVIIRMRDHLGAEVAAIRWKAHRLQEPDPRSRYLSSDEAGKLLAQCADHLRPAVELALLTGLRLGNLLGLNWRQIDMHGRQITFHVKSRKPGGKVHVLPITPSILVLLANLGPQDEGAVFRWKGRAIKKWRTAWRGALRRAGIADFRFHDLRHTAASWMVQEGKPLDQVQEVLGHEDIKTTQRYAHRDTQAKADAMEGAASRLRHATKSEIKKSLRQKGK